MSTAKKKKIAILGSGVASLAAALELTSVDDWQSKYEITIYQPGWRSGGKTTTGRGKNGRIEEVGIHIFQGWYNNAFKVVQQLYGEIEEKKLAPDSPFRSWEDAFAWENSTLLTEYSQKEDKWLNWPIIFPNNDEKPGTDEPAKLKSILKKVVLLMVEVVVGSPYGKTGCLPTWLAKMLNGSAEPTNSVADGHKFNRKSVANLPIVEAIASEVKKAQKHIKEDLEVQGLHHVNTLLDDLDSIIESAASGDRSGLDKLLHLLEDFMDWVDRIFGGKIEEVNTIRRIKTMVELAIVSTTGILRDVLDLKTKKLDFDRINHLDFREWLKQNGASELLLQSAPVRFLYTGTFANGENLIEAGTALHFLALSIGYKGAFVWKFKAGTGDTLIMPFYLVLKARGVQFRYFHKATEVHYSSGNTIEKISMCEQVKLRDGLGEYDPKVKMPDGIYAWPAKPLYEQIDPKQAQKLQAEDINLESAWSTWQNYRSYEMTKGVDFDEVILGVPIEVLRGERGICKEIIEKSQSWKTMADTIVTTATQAAQTWAYPTTEEMGMKLADWGLNASKGAQPNLVVYANPMYSWIDMSDIIGYEDWKTENKPQFLAYLCGSLETPRKVPYQIEDYPEKQLLVVKQNTKLWLQSQTAWFFPEVANPPEYPAGMKLDVFWANDKSGATDNTRLEEQHYQANIQPSDRWTLSLPNTGKTRLAVDGSGYENLFLAGDWVQMEINVGYTDGAMTSGLRAAQALLKKENISPVTTITSSEIEV